MSPTGGAMELSLRDFDYELSRNRIAQYPMRKRSDARLLVLDRKYRTTEHRRFADLVHYLGGNDCLVLNDTKVLRARLFGRKPTGGRAEILLHKKLATDEWEVLLKPSGRIRMGSRIFLGKNGMSLQAEVLDGPRKDSGIRRIRFMPAGINSEILAAIGRIPLPPYIDRPDSEIDRELYQTVYAKNEGAVASPTAGLHFDEALLGALRDKGVRVVFLTLHVGYGTFQPVAAEHLAKHEIHPEEYVVSDEAASEIMDAVRDGKRIVACGTTVVRTLETVTTRLSDKTVHVRAGCGETGLFIYPPYDFQVTQALITNFHLPRTTLLMLASAFAGHELLLRAYQEAMAQGYRFYSYGDAMLIL